VSDREDDPTVALAELAEAAALLERLGTAIFPGGPGDRRSVTWPDRAETGGEPGSAGRSMSEHDQTSARLRAAEARYRTLVEQIPAVTFMAVLGEGKNEIYVSPHVEAMLGFTQQEWLEDPFLWYGQLHPDDRALWNEEFTRGCQTGGPFRAECRFHARDGRVVWVHGEATLLKDDLGRPQFLQGVAFDITESKRAQAILLNEAVRTAKIEEDLAIARRVQTSILPRSSPIPGLEIAATMVPADEVGGDYYDVIPARGGCWIAIGDVSGHGLNAGLVMLMVQSALAAICRATPDGTPRDVLSTLNEVIFDNVRRRLEQEDFVTLSLLWIAGDGRVVFAGAHEEILVARRDTGQVERVASLGTWIGGMRDIRSVTTDQTITLRDGDVALLYTDGVTEARNAAGEQFNLDRLCAALARAQQGSPEQIRDHVLGEVRAWMARQEDDITVLALRFSRLGGGSG
jgi:PAS domain S-box-containing protein